MLLAGFREVYSAGEMFQGRCPRVKFISVRNFVCWEFIRFIQGARRPYSAIGKLSKTDANLPPEWPPSNASRWIVIPDCDVDDLVNFPTMLLKMNVPDME